MALTLTITPTDVITTIDGTPCRAWTGVTPDGHTCAVFVLRVVAPGNDPLNEILAKTLQEVGPPRELPLPLSLWDIL